MQAKIAEKSSDQQLIQLKCLYFTEELKLYKWFEENLRKFAWCDDCIDPFGQGKKLDCDCQEAYFTHCGKISEKFSQKQKKTLLIGQQIKQKQEQRGDGA